MTASALTLQQQTRIAVKIIIEDETGVLAFSILWVTGLFTLLWRISRLVAAFRDELSSLAGDLVTALDFTAKVLAISFTALAFGLGLKL